MRNHPWRVSGGEREKKNQYPFITKGTGGKGEKCKHRKGLNVSKKSENNRT
jgi:hypothetical protein